MANHISNAFEKLRNQNSVCSKIELFARTSLYKNIPEYYAFEEIRLSGETSNTLRAIKYSVKIVEKLFKQGYEYKKAGVKISNISNNNQVQLSLLEENDSIKSQKLMSTIDFINKINGPNTIRSASCGINRSNINKNFKSPRYLTGYTELPKAK